MSKDSIGQTSLPVGVMNVPYTPIELPNDYMVDLDGMWCGVEEDGSVDEDKGEVEKTPDPTPGIPATTTYKPTVKSEGEKLKEFFFPKRSSGWGRCECGIDASGSGGRHSPWCPKYVGGY